ncbi:MAG: hypothetical protein GWP08_10730 [Nitrospiraceae bacterium]|nr:hypothetical protein [Nitrospiraceae bacterium]
MKNQMSSMRHGVSKSEAMIQRFVHAEELLELLAEDSHGSVGVVEELLNEDARSRFDVDSFLRSTTHSRLAS